MNVGSWQNTVGSSKSTNSIVLAVGTVQAVQQYKQYTDCIRNNIGSAEIRAVYCSKLQEYVQKTTAKYEPYAASRRNSSKVN